MTFRFVRGAKAGFVTVVVLFDVIVFTYATVSVLLQNQVNDQLGFDYATPMEEQGEIFIITEVIPGKIMDRAGLKEGDVIPWDNVSLLYKMIVYHQGGTISIPVVRDRQYLQIRVKVPKLNLSIQPKWIYWM